MHELSIALGIVDGVLDEIQQRHLSQVEVVHLRVGRLSGVDKDALMFSYGIACQETTLSGSRLEIEDVEIALHCARCGGERPAHAFPALVCAECGSAGDKLLRGDELEISGLEVAA